MARKRRDSIPANVLAQRNLRRKYAEEPWLVVNLNDPEPKQPWYTPARYFARILVIDDSTLLSQRDELASKVIHSLENVGIYKRGGKKSFNPATIKKALTKINLG